MNLTVNEIYHGFRLVEAKRVEEINAVLHSFVHEKSGARLLSLENEDDNNVFSITFRTPPSSSNGAPHILEHCVLNSSRKYPVKDLFAELKKGSLCTYLNAGTADDRTSFSIASKNAKDFMNLMDAYLDCTLYPGIYDSDEYFRQQGWHYVLDSVEGELQYNGVVYNEMKGVYSWPEEVLLLKTKECLYPDTCYRYDAGGDPEHIPSLTNQELLDFHRRHYHPSNSFIYLYGNGCLLERLAAINGYLQGFDQVEVSGGAQYQQPFSEPRELTAAYSIAADAAEQDQAFLCLSFAVGDLRDGELKLAMEILSYALLGTPEAPLRKAVAAASLGAEVSSMFFPYVYQPFLSITVSNSSEENKARFREVVFGCLDQLVARGMDKDLLRAAINKAEFRLRESVPDKGMTYLRSVLQSFVYGGEPDAHLAYEGYLARMRASLDSGYFERLIEKYLLQNSHHGLVVLNPQKGQLDAKNQQIRKKLASHKDSLSQDEVAELVNRYRQLKEIQRAPILQAALDRVPRVSVGDVDRTVQYPQLIEDDIAGTRSLRYSQDTSGISYVTLLFDADCVDQQLIPYVGLLSRVLGKVDGPRRTSETLAGQLDLYAGGISLGVDTFVDSKAPHKYYPKLRVSSKVLHQNSPVLFGLMEEILSPCLDDPKKLKGVIKSIRSQYESVLVQQGQHTTANRLHSYISAVGRYNELVSGLDFYYFIRELDNSFDTRASEVIQNLQAVAGQVLSRQNMCLSFTGSEMSYAALRPDVSGFIRGLRDSVSPTRYSYAFDTNQRNEGLMTQSGVQYVAKGYDYSQLGHKYSGSLKVLSTVLARDYLWRNIRLKGGAYGCSVAQDRHGKLLFVSHRDPKLAETLVVYDAIPAFLRDFSPSPRELERYIVSTVGELDAPVTAAAAGEKALGYYLGNITEEDLQRERVEVLSTSAAEVRGLADLVASVLEHGAICVLGNEGTLQAHKHLFNSLTKV